ncbi:hypothetical protein RvY_00454-2 [Ramazzottius varieornatus]|uniref:NADPH-dependent FMN reductase-like domain-containing protein n=1 Tax=Ramazzottius varieornatus TaxID=947166 RepID=A0A1D1UN93_RAMVA|nr:hypothetical protein RvY_00454-2 [Ramazzottius varieornatus]
MVFLTPAGLHFILFLGSVRENRNAERVKKYLTNFIAKHNVSVEIFDPVEMAVYNYTKVVTPLHYYPKQEDAPQHLLDNNARIKKADGFIIVTPEYHSAVAPALSTLMDQFPGLSYAYRPAAIVSYSKGRFGGIRASTQLRTFLSELGMIHIPSVLAIAKVENTITPDGQTKDDTVLASTAAVVEELIWFATTVKEYSKVM